MRHTRRSVLRNSALLSLAGAVGASPLRLFGAPADFEPGIRIFFGGSWLFAVDPASAPGAPRMLALTLDMPGVPHRFPFGVWRPGSFGTNTASLPANPRSGYAGPAVPYSAIAAVGNRSFQSPAPDVDALFRAALCGDPFTYLLNTERKLSPDLSRPGLRVVSVPLPTRVIPAAFRVGASVSDPRGLLAKSPCQAASVPGVATTTIFEYAGATSMTLTLADGYTDIARSGDDYHFRTQPMAHGYSDHSAMMFQGVLGLIKDFDSGALSFNAPGSERLYIGNHVPATVSAEELQMVAPTPAMAHLQTVGYPRLVPVVGITANCAGGSVALGDGN